MKSTTIHPTTSPSLRATFVAFGVLAVAIACRPPVQAPRPARAAQERPAPAEVYGPTGAPVRLLVGNGGAGLLGLVRALSEDFLASRAKPYAIGWVKAGSGENFEYARQGLIDVGLTYEPLVERQLLEDGLISNYRLIFHDRFILAGPQSDPAGLRRLPGDVGDAFMRIAEAGAKDPEHVRFLSRDNTSGTTAKEHNIWTAIQAHPWEGRRPAPWYVRFDSFPTDALERANAIEAYTLNDLGTWIGNPEKRARLEIFREDGMILDNPCSVFVTVPPGGRPSPEAGEFADYLSTPGAQHLIAEFGKKEHGQALYVPAIPGTDELGRASASADQPR